MGAPGHYIICPKGHEIGFIEDDLYWDEKLFKELEELEKKKCPICGQEAKYNFCHYGHINDCTSAKLTWNSKEKRWIIPRKLTENHKKDLKDHIIRKDGIIKTEKVTKNVKRIDGTEISQMIQEDNLEVMVGDEIYNINAVTVLRMANEFRFDVVQEKEHRYLIPVEKFENGAYVSIDK